MPETNTPTGEAGSPPRDALRDRALELAVSHFSTRPNQLPAAAIVIEMAEAFLNFLDPKETPLAIRRYKPKTTLLRS